MAYNTNIRRAFQCERPCPECGRGIKPLGMATHRAMHYNRRKKAEAEKKATERLLYPAKNQPGGLHYDTIEDCLKRADYLSDPDGSSNTGMMCGLKDLRRIVLLAREYRNLLAMIRKIKPEGGSFEG